MTQLAVPTVTVPNGHDPILAELLDSVADELSAQALTLASFEELLPELILSLRGLTATIMGSNLERVAQLPKRLETTLAKMERWFSPGVEHVPINVPVNSVTAQLISQASPRAALQFTIPAPAAGATQYDGFFGYTRDVQNAPDTGKGPMGTRITAGGTQVMGPELADSAEVWLIMAPGAPVTTVTGYALLREHHKRGT
ncbi:MAG TPA: hypothetical protein VMU89_14745 [Thermomicrobiaceae bacterium]|nr:hypothetical protein [Thermomicrobiaceae bacterium]